MKYEVGNYVSKPITGICKVEDTLYMDIGGPKNRKLYYLLKPVDDRQETIYVPVDKETSGLRPCLTEEEAWELIREIPEIPAAWIENEKMREQKYKEEIKTNDPKALVSIIKMIYKRKKNRIAQGKKVTSSDAKYFQIAENLLYVELGTALGQPKQEVCQTIINTIDQSKDGE